MGFLPWEIWVVFPRESQLQQSRSTQPTVHVGCFSVSIIHWTLTWTTGSLTCARMLMHAIAHRVTGTCKSLHWKLTLGEKSIAAPGNQTCVSGMTVWCSNQLSYVPIFVSGNNQCTIEWATSTLWVIKINTYTRASYSWMIIGSQNDPHLRIIGGHRETLEGHGIHMLQNKG